jgi:hypothetical protein
MSDAPPQVPGRQRLSEWLKLMLDEIERKRRDLDAAHAEQRRRAAGQDSPTESRK